MSLRSPAEQRLRRRTLSQLEAWLEMPMIGLSFIWLGLVIAELLWGTGRVFDILGIAIWIVFLAEFAIRLSLAPDKLRFASKNWLTAIALLIPAFRAFSALRFLRAARAARGLRLIRVVGTANRGMNALRKSMSRRGVGYVVVLTTILTLLGAAGMMALEPASEVQGGFEHYGEALWWTAMLLTTMGTDFWPRTPEGRMLCLLLAVYAFAVWGISPQASQRFLSGRRHVRNRAK